MGICIFYTRMLTGGARVSQYPYMWIRESTNFNLPNVGVWVWVCMSVWVGGCAYLCVCMCEYLHILKK